MRVKTRKRHARLTNLDISTHYRKMKVWLFPTCILAEMAYWITAQNDNSELIEVKPILEAYRKKIMPVFKKYKIGNDYMKEFTYDELSKLISSKNFEKIPEILALNNTMPSFIDLEALSRNIFYGLLRREIIA